MVGQMQIYIVQVGQTGWPRPLVGQVGQTGRPNGRPCGRPNAN